MASGGTYGKVNEDDGTPESDRRIKQADFIRLKAQVDNALGRIDVLQAQLDGRGKRMSREEFAAHFFGNAAAWDGSKVKSFRDWCDAGYAQYVAFCDGTPRPTLEERYGGGKPEVLVAPKPAPIGNGLAIPAEKAPEPAAATA